MTFSEELCANHDSRYRAHKNRNSRSQIVSLVKKDMSCVETLVWKKKETNKAVNNK